jgi:hypothetical protein
MLCSWNTNLIPTEIKCGKCLYETVTKMKLSKDCRINVMFEPRLILNGDCW